MPLTKITTKNYLNDLVSKAPIIYSEYLEAFSRTDNAKPPGLLGWDLTEIVSNREIQSNVNLIPTLETAITALPENVYPIMITISTIHGGKLTDGAKHKEPYPPEMHRYHIPLAICDGATLNIKENDGVFRGYGWEEGFAFEFENPQNEHYLSHNDVLEDRTVMVIDVFEDVEPTETERILINKISTSFIKKDVDPTHPMEEE